MMHVINEDTYKQAVKATQFAKKMLRNAQTKKLPSIDYWTARYDRAQSRLRAMHGVNKKTPTATPIQHPSSQISSPKSKLHHAKVFSRELKNHATVKALFEHGKHLGHDLAKALKLVKGSTARKTKLFQHISNTVKGFGKAVANVNNLAYDFGKRLKTKFSPEEIQAMKHDPDTVRDKLAAKLTPREMKSLHIAGKIAYAAAGAYMLGSYGTYVGSSLKDVFTSIVDAGNVSHVLDLAKHHLPQKLQEHLLHATMEAGLVTAHYSIGHIAKFEAVENESVDGNLMMQLMEIYAPVFSSPDWQKAVLKGTQEYLNQ